MKNLQIMKVDDEKNIVVRADKCTSEQLSNTYTAIYRNNKYHVSSEIALGPPPKNFLKHSLNDATTIEAASSEVFVILKQQHNMPIKLELFFYKNHRMLTIVILSILGLLSTSLAFFVSDVSANFRGLLLYAFGSFNLFLFAKYSKRLRTFFDKYKKS